MVNLWEAQDILFYCCADNLIYYQEFILLYVIEQANPEFSYWTYLPFNLETCNAEFGFLKKHIQLSRGTSNSKWSWIPW